MPTLVNIRGIKVSGGSGGSQARGFRIKSSGGAQATVSHGANVQVDIEDADVRRTLRKNAGRWIEKVSGGANSVVIRGLQSSEASGRGFRIRPSGGGTDVRVAAGAAQTVDLSDGGTRRDLINYWKDYVPGAAGSSLITIRGLSNSEVASGSSVSRGLSVRNQAGVTVNVGPNANVQVDLADASVRRLLRRNRDRFVVVSAP
jgi:hypothetical protein